MSRMKKIILSGVIIATLSTFSFFCSTWFNTQQEDNQYLMAEHERQREQIQQIEKEKSKAPGIQVQESRIVEE